MRPDHLFNQTCTVSTVGDENRFGKNAYGDPVTYACRFQKTNRIMQTPSGEKTPIDGVVSMSASALVGINDKVIFQSETYRVMMIAPAIDGRGQTRHLKLSVQKWSLNG